MASPLTVSTNDWQLFRIQSLPLCHSTPLQCTCSVTCICMSVCAWCNCMGSHYYILYFTIIARIYFRICSSHHVHVMRPFCVRWALTNLQFLLLFLCLHAPYIRLYNIHSFILSLARICRIECLGTLHHIRHHYLQTIGSFLEYSLSYCATPLHSTSVYV